MKTNEIAVYDAYPQWMGHLVNVASAVKALPLDELLAVAVKISFAGAYIGTDKTEKVPPEAIAKQRKTIEAAIVFRDAVTAASE